MNGGKLAKRGGYPMYIVLLLYYVNTKTYYTGLCALSVQLTVVCPIVHLCSQPARRRPTGHEQTLQ